MAAAVDAVVVMDHRGKIQAVNDSTCRIFGYAQEELIGGDVGQLMPEGDRASHDDFLNTYLRTGRGAIIGTGRRVVARRRDGSLFPAALSVGRVPLADPPRFVGLMRDITAEVEATQALKLERDRSTAYLELNESILMSIDAERRICEVNERGAAILGARSHQLIGRDWLSLLHDEPERVRASMMLSAVLASGRVRDREFDALDAQSKRRRIRWRCIARREADGSPAGWLCSGEDLTERARREALSHIAQQRLAHVARLATMGEMAAGVAHELNQPLTAITAYARASERYLSMTQPDLDEARIAAREIAAEALRAGKIIARLRQLVRSDSENDRAPVDLNLLVTDLQSILAADARLYEARLQIALTPRLPRVRAQGVQLQQVVLNLVRNAFEALLDHPPGERAVELMTVHAMDGHVELRVTDNGPGIAPEIENRLFHPFATTKQAGTGLGLSVSHTIVKAHGGNIGHRAAPRGGTTFYVQLPTIEGE